MTDCPTFPPPAVHLSDFPGQPPARCDFWDIDQMLLSVLGDVGNVDKVADGRPPAPLRSKREREKEREREREGEGRKEGGRESCMVMDIFDAETDLHRLA